MSWSKNNRAHACLWFFEIWHHDQRDALFEPSGEWSTDFLIKAAPGESGEMRLAKCRSHAEMLDGAFTNLYRAKLESGVTTEDAIDRMVDVLNDKTKKLKDLGDPVDACYRFLGEV